MLGWRLRGRRLRGRPARGWRVSVGRVGVGCVAVAVALAGCSADPPASALDRDRALVAGYFDQLNQAGRAGPDAQQDLLRRTQHPDYRVGMCALSGLTLRVRPTLTTLRPAPSWTEPARDTRPRGAVYAVAVQVTTRRDGLDVASQIGTEHVVVLDGAAYGFAPCLNR